MPLYVYLLSAFLGIWSKLIGFTGGALMFCTRQAFEATGGFDERMFFAEEGAMALALKRQGRFVVLWPRVLSSGRRLRRLTLFQILRGAFQVLISPRKTMTTRTSLVESVWYNSNRLDDDRLRTGIAARVANTILLMVVLILIAGPVLRFVPWSATPLESVIGKVRLALRAIQTHVAILLMPAITLVLLRNLFAQKIGRQIVMSAVLAGLCAWQSIAAAKGIGWVWAQVLNLSSR